MRIFRRRVEHQAFEAMRTIANRGCDKCPECGESLTIGDYIQEGKLAGISGGICKYKSAGFFVTHLMKCDCYTCHTCGAQWESEWYYVS